MSNTDPASRARLLRSRAGAGPLRVEVSGASMGASIVSRSAVWVVAADQPRWGEIWAFADDSGVIAVHRFVGRRHGMAKFWGDGNFGPDPLRPDEFLVGKVVRIQDPAGRERTVGLGDRVVRASGLWLVRLPRRAVSTARRKVRQLSQRWTSAR